MHGKTCSSAHAKTSHCLADTLELLVTEQDSCRLESRVDGAIVIRPLDVVQTPQDWRSQKTDNDFFEGDLDKVLARSSRQLREVTTRRTPRSSSFQNSNSTREQQPSWPTLPGPRLPRLLQPSDIPVLAEIHQYICASFLFQSSKR